MAIKHLVFVDDLTGIAQSEWRGDDEKLPVAPDGRSAIDVTDKEAELGTIGGQVWDGRKFDPAPIIKPRKISRHEFLSLFTEAEETTLELLAYKNDTPQNAQLAAAIRVWQRRLSVATFVDLDNPEVAATLNRLKPVLISAGVWANSAIGDARVAAILANESPV